MNNSPNPSFEIDDELANTAWELLMSANNIAIVSHRHPDPDAVGSNLCLRQVLEKQGKHVDSLCINIPPASCAFLPQVESYQNVLQEKNYDLIITVDCGSRPQAAFTDIVENTLSIPLLNIDHHASNDFWGTLSIVYPELSSTSEIIYRLLEAWQQPIDPSMATYLMIGIYYDTGSFMHSNVTSQLLKIASQLLELGADLPAIKQHLFQNFTEDKFHLWGHTLENMKLSEQGTAIAVITSDTITESTTNQEALSGLIDYVSMIKGSEFALMINQENDHQIRGSLRTRKDEINVSEMAYRLGGGGHRKASGFGFPAKLEKQTIWTIIK